MSSFTPRWAQKPSGTCFFQAQVYVWAFCMESSSLLLGCMWLWHCLMALSLKLPRTRVSRLIAIGQPSPQLGSLDEFMQRGAVCMLHQRWLGLSAEGKSFSTPRN